MHFTCASQHLLDWKGDWRKPLELSDYSIKRGLETSGPRRKINPAYEQDVVVKKQRGVRARADRVGARAATVVWATNVLESIAKFPSPVRAVKRSYSREEAALAESLMLNCSRRESVNRWFFESL